MTITNIQQAKRQEDRVNVFIDGKFSLNLSKNDLLELQFYKGQELTAEQLVTAKQTAIQGKVQDRITRYLALRPRSSKEVLEYLRYKVRLEPDAAGEYLAKLQVKGLVNDLKFASWWLESRLQFKNYSMRQIEAELVKKGISSEQIKQAEMLIPAELISSAQQANITNLFVKFKRRHRDLPSRELRSKALQYLANKGYNYEDIQNLLNQEL